MTKEVKYYFGIPFEVRSSADVTAAPAEQAQPATKPATKPKFKVGDRVRLKGDNSGFGSAGDEGEILGLNSESVRIRFDTFQLHGNNVWYANPDNIELLQPTSTPTFTPGQRVRLTRNAAGFAVGDEGRVVAGGERVLVKMDDRGVLRAFEPDDLMAADCAGRKEQREAKPKFKAGDVVRCLEDREPGRQFTKGSTYTVRDDVPDDGCTYVGIKRDDKGSSNGWCQEHFELVSAADCPQDNAQQEYKINLPPSTDLTDVWVNGRLYSAKRTQPAIVALVKNGQPRPADRPYVHANADGALQEASRLARNNPGQEFAVYQRVAGRVCETTYNMKEVA